MTPEQMRALANAADNLYRDNDWDAEVITDAVAALRAAADQLEAVRQQVSDYAGWYEDAPEDSWRFERDLRTALGMEQYSGGER